MGDSRCPNCGMHDQVQRMAVVHAQGLSNVQLAGPTSSIGYGPRAGMIGTVGWQQLSGYSQQQLSAAVGPPPRPRSAGPVPWWAWLMALPLIPLCLAIFAAALSVSGGGGTTSATSSGSSGSSGASATVLVVLIAVLAIVLYFWGRRRRRRLAVRLVRWNQEVELWNHMFCCLRCGGAFLPQGALPVAEAGVMLPFGNVHALLRNWRKQFYPPVDPSSVKPVESRWLGLLAFLSPALVPLAIGRALARRARQNRAIDNDD